MDEEIAIVDYECMTSLGQDFESTWNNMINGESGINRISRYNPSDEVSRKIDGVLFGGQIPIEWQEMAESQKVFAQFTEPAIHGVSMVCENLLKKIDFNISEHAPQRVAILGGTALTGQISQEKILSSQKSQVTFILNQCHNIPLSLVARKFGIEGPSFSLSAACSSSNHALFIAQQLIKSKAVDLIIVVGFEFPISPTTIASLKWINALYSNFDREDRAYTDPTTASRPFSVDRAGFVASEGVGAVILTSLAYAKKMNWEIKNKLIGGYLNTDGGHLTRMDINNILTCMASAIKSAKINIEHITSINAHATSTIIGDACELNAINKLFSHRMIDTPIVANKSQLGHSIGACSIIEFIVSCRSLEQNILPPTLNYIPDSDLPTAFISDKVIESKQNAILLNSFGFGGANSSIVIGKTE